MHIGTVKFARNFKESPCSAVATFPSFGSERHGSDPIGGTPRIFFSFLCGIQFPCLPIIFFFFGRTKLGVKTPFRNRTLNLADRKIYKSSHVMFACIQWQKTCQSTDLDSGKVVLFGNI